MCRSRVQQFLNNFLTHFFQKKTCFQSTETTTLKKLGILLCFVVFINVSQPLNCSEYIIPNSVFGTKNAILFRTESEFCSEQNRSFVPNTLFRTFYTNCSEQDFFVVPNKLFGTRCSEHVVPNILHKLFRTGFFCCSEQTVRNKVFRTRCSEHFTQTVLNRIFLLFRSN